MTQFVQFSYLQLLDFLTTIAFLLHGVKEANPLVQASMSLAGSPLYGLLAVKLLAVGLGFWCWRMQRNVLLSRINVFFALLVAWNVVALIANSAVA